MSGSFVPHLESLSSSRLAAEYFSPSATLLTCNSRRFFCDNLSSVARLVLVITKFRLENGNEESSGLVRWLT